MSYISRRSPQLSLKAWANKRTDVFGNVTDEGSTPEETLDWRLFESYKTPGFKSLRRNELPYQQFHAATAIRIDYGGGVSKPSSYYSGGMTHPGTVQRSGSVAYSCGAASVGIDTGPATDIVERCIVTARGRALSSSANMKMNLAQSFAERKQTAGLLVNTVNRFVTFAVLARKGKFSEANKLLKGRPQLLQGVDNPRRFQKDALRRPGKDEFASLWLEYSYGWRPLLSDVYGAAELLAQTATKTRPLSSKGQHKDTEHQLWEYDGGLYQGSASIRAKWDVKSRTEYFFDIEQPMLDVLKSTGITNPVLLAWELLPYSFVVDWFLPVGNYLKQWDAVRGLRFIKGYQSTLLTRKIIASPMRAYDNFPAAGLRTIEQLYVRLDREPIYSFPIPTLPRFSMDLNLSQVTSALALLNQLFRR